jgi:hypothetical protein
MRVPACMSSWIRLDRVRSRRSICQPRRQQLHHHFCPRIDRRIGRSKSWHSIKPRAYVPRKNDFFQDSHDANSMFGACTKAAPRFKLGREQGKPCPRRRAASANHSVVSKPTTGRLWHVSRHAITSIDTNMIPDCEDREEHSGHRLWLVGTSRNVHTVLVEG